MISTSPRESPFRIWIGAFTGHVHALLHPNQPTNPRPPYGIEQTPKRETTVPHVGYEWAQCINAPSPPMIYENPSVGVQGLAFINPHNTTTTSQFGGSSTSSAFGPASPPSCGVLTARLPDFLASVSNYSGFAARSIATTTFSLGRSDLQTLDSYQVSMGGSSFAHPMGPNVALLQPPSRPLAHLARSHVASHKPSGLHMHPLLAYSRLHAPFQYDVGQIPSAQTVLDCTTRSPVPPHTLAQPATDPPIGGLDQLLLKSHKLPWTIVVKSWAPALRAGRLNSRTIPGGVITNSDVLYTIHTTLLARVTPEEWEALGNESRAQKKVKRAYEKRCSVMGGWDGVRRVDWLGCKNHLVGIEVDRSNGNNHGKLIFAQIV